MDRITAARVFVETVGRGSVSRAAEHLDMSRAMASRYVSSLEDWANARLLHRTTRRLSLTEAGKLMLPLCEQMLAVERAIIAPAGAGIAGAGISVSFGAGNVL